MDGCPGGVRYRAAYGVNNYMILNGGGRWWMSHFWVVKQMVLAGIGVAPLYGEFGAVHAQWM